MLGLTRRNLPEWGDYPVFMMAHKTGVALFPAHTTNSQHSLDSKHIKIDHFAFQVDQENFANAKERYAFLQLDFTIEDHHYFHSIYTKDPDGHTVELTTLVVAAHEFYKP